MNKKMHVVLKTTEAAFVRVIPADGDSEQVVSDLIHHSQRLGLEPVNVCIENESNLMSAPAHSLYFSNICGKIQHYDVCRVAREEVQPYINHISDAFGRFQCLYSRECSLRTTERVYDHDTVQRRRILHRHCKCDRTCHFAGDSHEHDRAYAGGRLSIGIPCLDASELSYS